MMLLIPLLVTPAMAALFCLLARSRRVMAFANVLALAGITVALGVGLLLRLQAPPTW